MKTNISYQIIFLMIPVSIFSSCTGTSKNIVTIAIYVILFAMLIGLLWYNWWKRKRIKAENSSVTKFNSDIQRILAKLDTSEEKINALNYALERVLNNEEYKKNKPWRVSLIVTIYLHMTMVYSEQGNNEKVIQMCNEILELNPKHALSFYNRGYTYNKIGKKDEALADLQKYLVLDVKDRWGLRSNVQLLLDEIKQNK